MGVKISDIMPDPTVIEYFDLKNRIVGIDAFNALYQFVASIGRNGEPLKDTKGRVTSHLSGLFYRTIKLIEYGIKPVYVFDGPPNDLKQAEIDRRKAKKREALKKAQEAEDDGFDEEAAKYYRQVTKVTKEMVEESKDLLKAMGLPYVESPEDAEAQAAWMCANGDIYSSATQDYDSITFGSPRTVRNLTLSKTTRMFGKTIIRELELIHVKKVLDYLKVTQNQLIDVAILVGTDFMNGVKYVGQKTALKFIKKYENIEGIMENNVKVRQKPIELDMDLVNQVRDLFRNPRHTEDFTLEFNKPISEDVKKILCDDHDFSETRITSGIRRISAKPKQQTMPQDTLDSFF